jgi:heme-degrading monooxygenase HmoA
MAVIELVTFRLAPGVDEDEFLDADRRAQTEFLYRQPGLLRRTTARGEASQWLVVSSWGSAADADASAEASRHHAAAARLDACLDPSSVVSNRYQTID